MSRFNAIQHRSCGLCLRWILPLLFLPVFGTPFAAGIQVREHTLDNGFKILLYPTDQAPVVACRLFFTTGSVHESPGNTGIAHMLEHMLFKGTKIVGITDSVADQKFLRAIDSVVDLKSRAKDSLQRARLQQQYDSLLAEHRKLFVKDELWETYLKAGGTSLNAFTSDLVTAYYVTLPKNKLELFLWLESDRMQNGVLREFYPERDVVMEERRMRYEDQPLGRYFETLSGTFYEAHPYRFPTIGYASDIAHYTRRQAEEHYRKYYKPNNAILVLAGDFEPESTLEKITRYFEGIPRGEEHAEIVTREPEQIGQKRLILHKNEAKPRLDILFHTPGMPHKDLYALDILEGALSGKSGRLHQRLVRELKIATSAGAGNYVDKYTSSFRISVELGSDPKPEQVEKEVWKILRELGEKPITPRELQRVKNQVTAKSMRELLNMEHLATQLAFYQVWGTWEYINIFPEMVQQVEVEDVREVVNKYFAKSLSTVGVVLPEKDDL